MACGYPAAILGTLLLVLALFAETASSCRCAGEPSVYKQYDDFTHVFRAKVKRRVQSDRHTYYKVKFRRGYKGCQPKRKVLIKTADNSAACGVILEEGRHYFLFANKEEEDTYGFETYSVHSCAPHRRTDVITRNEKRFLKGKQFSCVTPEREWLFCANGSSPYKKCAVGWCDGCDERGKFCDSTVCRGCGPAATWIFDSDTGEYLDSCARSWSV